MTTVKVTIIMPAYNSERFIRHALESIPKRDDIEIIVVNDGSTDNTRKISEEFDVNIINHDTNLGIGQSRRDAINVANGEYIMFFDSDDEIVANNFNKALDMLDGSDIVYYDLKQNNGIILHLTEKTKTIYPGADKFIKHTYMDKFEYPNVKQFEDVVFNETILNTPHTEQYTNLIVVNYNFPREDSTSAKWLRGEL